MPSGVSDDRKSTRHPWGLVNQETSVVERSKGSDEQSSSWANCVRHEMTKMGSLHLRGFVGVDHPLQTGLAIGESAEAAASMPNVIMTGQQGFTTGH